MIVVSDASPLISLAVVGQLDLLRKLYAEVLIPEAVDREVAAVDASAPGAGEIAAASWIRVQAIQNSPLAKALSLKLDEGEAEAIVLAVESAADLLLVDERRARAAAVRLGCRVVGVLGVLLDAKAQGHLPLVRRCSRRLPHGEGYTLVGLYTRRCSTRPASDTGYLARLTGR